jgi:mono/diheme cytochrome c family protein
MLTKTSALLAATALLGLAGLAALGNAAPAAPAPSDPAQVARGEYLARAGDCVACHTALGGTPFAGGLPIRSDLGTIYSTNITPDREQGIGSYTEAQFSAALREGRRADGTHLYPAMPYPSYSRLSDEDIHALYAYFMEGVAPSANRPPATELGFPFNQRWGMWAWNLVFSPSGAFQPDPKASEEVNRGAYIVEGLGHCGSCHTPRGLGMQEKAYRAGDGPYLAGADLNGWHAPSLQAAGNAARGVAGWSVEEIVDYLGTGRNSRAAVGGEMKSVVEHSLSHLNDADLRAIAVYLKTLGARPAPATTPAADPSGTTARLTRATWLNGGERLYLDNCGACHFVNGQGAARVFPQLDGASIVNAENPTGLIHTILTGAQTPSTERAPSVLPMPGFGGRLSDQEVAELATFLRTGWTNRAPAVTAKQVAEVRRTREPRHEASQTGYANQRRTPN